MIAVAGESREVALAESQAVLAMARDETMRSRLAGLVAELEDGEVDEAADLLEQVLELGLQTGRIRAYYGPGGEQASLRILRRLPRGKARTESAAEVSKALSSLAGKVVDRVSVSSVAPGSYVLTLDAGGFELVVRLDSVGARLASAAT